MAREATPRAKTPGQLAYEADVRALPRYPDGGARRSWDGLDEIAHLSWERNPTPRFVEPPASGAREGMADA